MICVRLNKKAIKNIYFRINARGELEINAPLNPPYAFIAKLIDKKHARLEAKILAVATAKAKARAGYFTYLGKAYKLIFAKDMAAGVSIGGDELRVGCAGAADPQKVLDEWTRQEAARIFNASLEKFLHLFDRKPRVSIKKMKTRWGSCNYRKAYISLNLELIRRGTDEIDYVVLHELAHLIHPNHSKDFYRFIESVMPNFRASIVKLRQ